MTRTFLQHSKAPINLRRNFTTPWQLYTLFNQRFLYLIYIANFNIGSLVFALVLTSETLAVKRAVAGSGVSGILLMT